MPLLNTSIPNLAQGVSQQPDNLRYPGQCDEQINAWSTVVEGLVKRPNSRFLYDTDLGADISSNLFTHFVDRDDQNKYAITYDSVNGLKAFDVTQGVKTSIHVNMPSIAASTYLSVSGTPNPLQDLRALTVADSTFLVNTQKTIAKDTTLKTPSLDYEALIFVKLGDYQKSYNIYIDDALVPLASSLQDHHDYSSSSHGNSGVQASTYVSGPADVEPKGNHADTAFIAKDLADCISEFTTTATQMSSIAISGGTGFPVSEYRSTTKYTYEFLITQTDAASNITATGAKGTLSFTSNGTYSSHDLTHGGSNYVPTSTVGITTNYTIRQHKTVQSVKYNIFRQSKPVFNTSTIDITSANAAGYGYGFPTFTPTIPGSGASGLTVEVKDSVIKITNPNTDFSVRVSDGLADRGIGAIYKEVDSITDLPKSCFNGFRVKVVGDAELDQDDYYVRFESKDKEDYGEGSWIETVGWTNDGISSSDKSLGIETTLDSTTMPVRLIPDQATGKITSLTLKTVEWNVRTSGDDYSNPFPSFTNTVINDIFFFKNRLGLLTNDTVVFSEADEYFNFFRTTTQTLLDSAPIDVGISHTKISLLKYAQAFQEKLMLFSAKTQFVLRGADLLTPKTVTISPVTEYDVSESIRPLALSSHIYFNFKRNNFEGLLEYTVDNNTETYSAAEITEQVNKYIPSNIVRMEGSAAENMIIVQSDSDFNKLFLYKYFWQGREKIQSSWMSFSFTRKVISFKFIESTLYVITTDSDGTYLEKIPMENGLSDTGKDYALLLDGRVDGNSSYVGLGGWYPKGSTPLSINSTTVTNVSLIVGANGFKFQNGMSFYTKNGNKRTLTIDNADPTRAAVSGLIASFVSYSSHVTHNNKIYKCIQNHTADSAKEPGVGADWEEYWIEITTTIQPLSWSLSTSYITGGLYLCTTGHTSSPTILPDAAGSFYWNNASGLIDSAPAWSPDGYEYISQYDFFVGFEYDMLYRFSKQNLKQPTERGGRSASDYTYQTIRNGSIEYSETGHFNVEVTPKFRDTFTYTYNPALLASVSTLNKFTPETGFFKFAVQAQPNDATIEIKSSSALPVKLLSAEFESTIISRSRRYGS
jgi:hypothetical protein